MTDLNSGYALPSNWNSLSTNHTGSDSSSLVIETASSLGIASVNLQSQNSSFIQNQSQNLAQSLTQNQSQQQNSQSSAQATPPQAPKLGDCLDYRKFLASFYDYRREISKRELRPYNYGVFSAAADIKSPNYLKLIIEGKRNLSGDMIAKFAKALGFNKELSEEFRLLVEFNQSTDPAERNLRLKELSDFRVRQQIQSGELDANVFSKVPNWATWVLYALLDQEGASFKIDDLKRTLRGKASKEEIETAIKALVHSGEIVIDDVTGKLSKSTANSDIADEIPVSLIRKIQSQLMFLGLESLYHDGPAEREFGTLTLSMTKSEFEELKFKLRQLRKQTHKDNAIKRMTSKGERVYQLNLQLFPVTDAK